MWCMPFGEPLFQDLACPPRTCWYLPPATPVSAALAQRSRCSVAGQWERGLFSISLARRHSCTPRPPPRPCLCVLMSASSQGSMLPAPFPPSSPVGSGVCALGMLGVNCSSIEGKWGQLVAYIVLHDPDFVCLQELWVDLDPARMVRLPYRLFFGDTFRGGHVTATLCPQCCVVWYHCVPRLRPARCTLSLLSSPSARAASRPEQSECIGHEDYPVPLVGAHLACPVSVWLVMSRCYPSGVLYVYGVCGHT